MNITGTHINYYFICHRKLWLFANGINMEHTSELVAEGKFIHETTYQQRSDKYTEIELEGIKIDYFDPVNKVIHETKKSGSHEEAHRWQLKYYMYVLKQHGMEGVKGVLEYPKLRDKEELILTAEDEGRLQQVMSDIETLVASDTCPPRIKKSKCRKCSYFDFCWSNEEQP
jgi:CRISPR-associated exonuclease Cas4